MKTLVVYYSRSGHTKKVAVALSRILKSDIEELVDLKDRNGIIGWLYAGRDSYLKNVTKIKKPKSDPKKYGMVFIGTPTWASNISPAIRTYCTKMKKRFRKVAFFCTKGGIPQSDIFPEMKLLCGKKPAATLGITDMEMRNGEFFEKVKKFSAKVKGGA